MLRNAIYVTIYFTSPLLLPIMVRTTRLTADNGDCAVGVQSHTHTHSHTQCVAYTKDTYTAFSLEVIRDRGPTGSSKGKFVGGGYSPRCSKHGL